MRMVYRADTPEVKSPSQLRLHDGQGSRGSGAGRRAATRWGYDVIQEAQQSLGVGLKPYPPILNLPRAETTAVEPLREDAPAVGIAEQNANLIASPIREDEQAPVTGVSAETLERRRGEPIEGPAEVDGLRRDIDSRPRRNHEEVLPSKARISAARPGRSGRRTKTSPTTTSIASVDAATSG